MSESNEPCPVRSHPTETAVRVEDSQGHATFEFSVLSEWGCGRGRGVEEKTRVLPALVQKARWLKKESPSEIVLR